LNRRLIRAAEPDAGTFSTTLVDNLVKSGFVMLRTKPVVTQADTNGLARNHEWG